MMLHTSPLGVVNVLISKVLHVSVIAPCVEEPVRTEVAHDLEDGHAAVLDLRRIGLPGLGPPLPRQEVHEGSLVDHGAQRGRVAKTAVGPIPMVRSNPLSDVVSDRSKLRSSWVLGHEKDRSEE